MKKHKTTTADYNTAYSTKKTLLLLGGICLYCFILYYSSFSNDFTLRDDDDYVTKNYLLGDLSWNGIKKIFVTLYYNGHLPVTILSLALDYHFWGLNPIGYHITNFALHIINTILVFQVIKTICRRNEVALLSALLFAIHPLGVQSVAWIAERKNVLYTTFYFASLWSYIIYLQNNTKKYVFISFILFVFSVASKWSAYTFPVAILIFDYYYKRKLDLWYFFEKIAFFSIPFISFYFHMKSGVAIANEFNFIDRFFFGSYTFVFYILKILLPFDLSAIYPYPKKINDTLPGIYYLSLVPAIGILAVLFYTIKKKVLFHKEILVGFLFFLFNIAMVLQVLKFIGGHELAADRYTYVPGVGIFFIISLIFSHFYNKTNKNKTLYKIGLTVYVIAISISTVNRTKVWANTETLYNDVVENYPNFSKAYLLRGQYYKSIKNYTETLNDYNKSLALNENYADAYIQRGILYYDIQDYEKSKLDLLKGIQIDSTHHEGWNYLGLAYLNTNPQKSAEYFKKAIQNNTKKGLYYNNLGYAYEIQKDYINAEKLYNKTIEIDSLETLAYVNRGWLYINKESYSKAAEDFKKAIKLNPTDASNYNSFGWAMYNLKRYNEALKYFNTALNMKLNEPYIFYNIGLTELSLNNTKNACEAFKTAVEKGHIEAKNYYSSNCI